MPSTPTRRRFLAAGAGACAVFAGCSNRDAPTDAPSDSPTDTAPPTPADEDGERPTATPRNPTPVDVRGAWPQAGFDPGHAGVTDATGVPDGGEAHWHLRRVRSGPPVLSDGRLFHYGLLGADERGSPTLTQTPPTGTSQPLDGRPGLFCRDARDGRGLWTRAVAYRGSQPTVAGDLVLVGGDGVVAAYRVDDGRERWRRDLGSRRATVTTAIGGTALVSTGLGHRYARRPDVRAYGVADGTPRWKRPSPLWEADLAAAGDTAFALSSQFQVGSVLTARSLADGDERWSVDLDDSGIPLGPFAAGGTVYVAPDDDGVHAFDAAEGSRRWQYDAATANTVGLAASAETAYLVDDGRLVAVDAADGTERWSVSTSGGRGYADIPAVGADTVYLENWGFPADLVALSRSDGRERWSYTLPETVVGGDAVTSGLAAQPAVADGAVYAYAEDGLYAFGPSR